MTLLFPNMAFEVYVVLYLSAILGFIEGHLNRPLGRSINELVMGGGGLRTIAARVTYEG